MSHIIEFKLEPEKLEEGSQEKISTFGLLRILFGDILLSEGYDHHINANRDGPLIAGYFAAEWLLWNWWRLRWEPRSRSEDWWRAHKMTAIGEGYVWPNITIYSDGERTVLLSEPSHAQAIPFRYLGAVASVAPSVAFEAAVDAFALQIIQRLRLSGLTETPLDLLWRELLDERADPEQSARRRIEALLGCEPDAADVMVDQLIEDGRRLGQEAIQEVAADHPHAPPQTRLLSAKDLLASNRIYGRDGSLRDIPRLDALARPHRSADTPAWRLGQQIAQALRTQEILGDATLTNKNLAALAGCPETLLTDCAQKAPISLMLDKNSEETRISLRSGWESGRRFDLARLIGDRLLSEGHEPLFPATRAYTYRQKFQRSFAAELLCPFETLKEMMNKDYSEEQQADVAVHFNVSPVTIKTMLKNHRCIPRDDEDIDALDAA